ncbi:MAG: inorganic diphosphatase [Rhodothermales bacterium]
MPITVFIQNVAGSTTKHRHDEKMLELQSTEQVSRAYPFPYGFVIDTAADDGLNVDCFVITERRLRSGQIVECEPIGLMEQIDAGAEDHNVIARLPDEHVEITSELQDTLIEFARGVFEHVPDKPIEVGRFLDAEAALEHIRFHAEDVPGRQEP